MFKKLLSLALPMVASVCMAQTDTPVLSFGVMTDLHNQQTLISGDVSSVQLRGTVKDVLAKIKTDENLDLLVLNGDFTSDVTIPYENWLRVRELIVEGTRGIFPEGAKTPVLYCNGNHEYEVANFDNLPKPYNAGDFYSSPMKTDIGELSPSDCFYEFADNGSNEPMKLLAAYHYVIKGFDFVVLNTGKYFFKYAWDYQYSLESVQWVADKLAEIHAANPNKTVFFLSHLPFSDSKSMSNANKGLKDCEATTLLKSTLANYPNIVHVYGHDHGSDNAYIRTETAQRVTQYDTKGNLCTDPSATSYVHYLKSAVTGQYLGRTADANNIETYAEKMGTTITASDENPGEYSVVLHTSVEQKNLYIGTNGRYSGNAKTGWFKVYEVSSNENGTAKGKLAAGGVLEDGKSYIIVGEKSSKYYACTNEIYGSGSGQRLVGAEVTIDGDEVTYVDEDPTDNNTAIWNMEVEAVVPSFHSAFAGSMRYYNNSINGGSTVANSSIAQALMIYVYQDSVVLQMKNYAQTGQVASTVTLAETPAPYVIERTVVGNGVASRTVSVEAANAAQGTVTIKSPVTESTSVTTDERVVVEATPSEKAVFKAWEDGEGNVVSTSNPYTYNGTADITLVATFAATEYPVLTHSFSKNDQQNRFLDRVTYTVGGETKEIFNLDLGKEMLSAFPENVNIEDGGNALISYLEPVIEVQQGATSFDLTCYSTHYSITVGEQLYKNNMTWTNQIAFVDWNCDFDFNDANELYAATEIENSSSSTNPPTHVFRLDAGYTRTFAVPADIQPGTYRMYVVYGQEANNWTFDQLFTTNNIYAGNAYEFTVKVCANARTVSVQSSDETQGSVSIISPEAEGSSISTGDPVVVEAIPANSELVFEAWVDGEGNVVSTENPYTYGGTADITLIAKFKEKVYPRLTHSWSKVDQQNRFLDRITYTAGANTGEIFNLDLGKEMLSAFPENINIEDGGSAMISYLEPAIEVPQGESGFDLTCYSTHYSITVDGQLYKNNMTWVNQAVYVDWNCDGDFLDAKELYDVTSITGTSSSTNPPTHVFRLDAGYTRTIAIPEGVELGEYRMYVVYGENVGHNWTFDDLWTTNNIYGGNAYELTIKVTGNEAGVEGVVAEPSEKAMIYDLSGRRVLAPVKGGIYIKNGKKFIVK